MTNLKKKLFAAVLLATTAMAVSAQPHTSVFGEPKTRAEVRADLELWKKAGLDKFWAGESTPDTFSREYRSAYAEYVRLRSGPEYNAEVQRQSGL
ncbi:DUF4148 domain-containing protein [Nitrosomonas eutropha]|uniref:Uncharacterized protein DUF4148 n=2 Tax=Nitrosomonas eutropha TaxID=916 RepID=A0ABX5MB19_9PROT|nr:DUF4148 domain-containing protein [Nitrosomonas eutropha]ABI58328.1 hypothetical protein Neut_0038 [Nitrosomonas eutropha C91]PXV84150.1 uncharacterized protein DUF4148 [Nitrosomonas eutropha]